MKDINKDSVDYKAGYKNALHEVMRMIKENGKVTYEELKNKRNSIKL